MPESLTPNKDFGFLSAAALKVLACVTMLMDHVGYCYYFTYAYAKPFRAVGRMSFPLFAFLIATGYSHTKDINRYLLRLLLFALITEPFFDRCFENSWFTMTYQNALFTLFLGLLAIYMGDMIHRGGGRLLCLAPVFLCCLCASQFDTDYGYWGVLTIVLFYLFRGRKWWQLMGAAATLLLYWGWPFAGYELGQFWREHIHSISYSQLPILGSIIPSTAPTDWDYTKGYCLLAFIPIFFYSGKSGMPQNPRIKKPLQILFYAFYPLHLAVLILCKLWL